MKKKLLVSFITLIAVLSVGCITASAYDYYDDYDYGPYQLTSSNVKLSKYTYTYNGQECTPDVTVTYGGYVLDEYYDYYVSYSNNKNAGTATVTVSGTGDYYGTVKKTFKIKRKKIKKVYFNKQHFDFKAKNPAVYINIKRYDYDYDYYYNDRIKVPKKSYKMKISGNHKKVGTYTAVIKFKGNYTGTVKKKFKINPPKVRKLKAKALSTKQVKFSWAKAPGGIDGYEIYKYSAKKGKWCLYKRQKGTSITITKNSSVDDDGIGIDVRTYKKVKGKKYVSDFKYKYGRTKLNAPKMSISRSDFGEFHAKFPSYGYYQIEWSDNKKFKTSGDHYVRSCRYYTNDVRFYNFTSGKKVYLRARKYYYTDSGKLKVGPWCKVKSVVPW